MLSGPKLLFVFILLNVISKLFQSFALFVRRALHFRSHSFLGQAQEV